MTLVTLHYKLFYAFNTSSYHNDLQDVQKDGKFPTSCEAIPSCLMPPAGPNLLVTVNVQYRSYVTRSHTSLPSHLCFVIGETWGSNTCICTGKIIPLLTHHVMTVSSRTEAPWGLNHHAYFGYPEWNFMLFYSVPDASSWTVTAFTPRPVQFTSFTSHYTAIILHFDVNSTKIPHGAVPRKTIEMVCMEVLSDFILEIMPSMSMPWRCIEGAHVLTFWSRNFTFTF